jgi:nucleoside-diphosphate-sugar epimerase
MPEKRRVSILGCGWYGFPLATSLKTAGYEVKGSTTSPGKMDLLAAAGINPYLVHFEPGSESWTPAFFDCDVLFIAFPPKVKQGATTDYISRLQRIINAIEHNQVKQVVFISSTGIYGDHNGEVNELTSPEPTTLSGIALQTAENLLQLQQCFTTTVIRFGGLFGPGRDPGRFFAGKKDIPNGQAPVNLIHLADCIGISHALLDTQAFGHIYNACSPEHPSKAAFYTQAAARSELSLPEFTDELLEWKIVRSVHMQTLLGYDFLMPLI